MESIASGETLTELNLADPALSSTCMHSPHSQALIVHADGKLLHESYELADATTSFSLLCVSKVLFAITALQTIEESKGARLGDAISRYIPEFADRPRIEIGDLLTFTSGVTRDMVPGDWPEERLLQFLALSPIRRERGPHYSTTTDWFLLGKVIEAITGESRVDLFRKTWESVGVRYGYGDVNAYRRPVPVIGWRPDGETGVISWPTADRVLGRAYPGTGVWSTAADLSRAANLLALPPSALAGHQLEKAVALLKRPARIFRNFDGDDRASRTNVSLGARVGSSWLGQKGQRGGVGTNAVTASFMFGDSDSGISVVYLSNAIRDGRDIFTQRKRIVDRVFDALGV